MFIGSGLVEGVNLNVVFSVETSSSKLYPTKLSVSSFCKSTPALFKLDFCIKKLSLPSPNNIRSDISILLNNEVLLLVTIKRLLNNSVWLSVGNSNNSKKLSGLPWRLVNSLLMSSIIRTSFVLHSMKSDNLISLNRINLPVLSETSVSTTKSIFFISSTLFSSNKSSMMLRPLVTPTVADVDEVIPVSAKFFIPLVCKILLTGVFKLSHSIGLWIE